MRGGIGIHVEQCRLSTVVEPRMASSILTASLLSTGFLASSFVIISGGIRRVGGVSSSWNGSVLSSGNLNVSTLLTAVDTPAFYWGHQGMHCIVQRRYVCLCSLQ
jgi:hypothetical protein